MPFDVSAEAVDARLSQHEAVCAERWSQIRTSVKSLWWLVLISAGTLICGEATLILRLLPGH
jgi:hypothetical protein